MHLCRDDVFQLCRIVCVILKLLTWYNVQILVEQQIPTSPVHYTQAVHDMLSMARQAWRGRQVSPVHCWHGRQVNKQIPIHVGPDGETCSTKIASLELVYFDSNMSTLLNNRKQQILIASSNW